MKRSKLVFAVCVLSILTAVGCKKDTPPPSSPPAPQTESGSPGPQLGGSLSGKVVETMNSGGYTYVSLENNGKKIWVAAPEAKVKVGQTVTCQPGMEMKNFTSKTLNRTFERIIFSGGIS